MPIRTLLVDDSPEFLRALQRLLSSDPEIEVIDHVCSARDALEKVDQSRVELILMDIAMPGMNGLEATRRIKAQANAPRVLLLTLYDSKEYRAAAQDVCADGFVSKLSSDEELLPLIHTIFAPSPATTSKGVLGNDLLRAGDARQGQETL
jgi:two-component system invasion response regulator UvrY